MCWLDAVEVVVDVVFGAVPLNVVGGVGVPWFEAVNRSSVGDWNNHCREGLSSLSLKRMRAVDLRGHAKR